MVLWESLWPQLDSSARVTEVQKYFAQKSACYDAVDQQPYWVFSDALLWELLRHLVLDELAARDQITLLDAGCGTARWSIKILQYLPSCIATLLDISPEMLAVAQKKLDNLNLRSRTSLIQYDLHNLASANETFDCVICFHNVLSFISDPKRVVNALVDMTVPGGVIALVVPNYYHALYFSLAQGRWKELDRIRDRGSVKFTDDVPEMLLFTPSLVASLLRDAGTTDIGVFGFPVTVYPQIEETGLSSSSSFALTIFAQEELRETLTRMELQLCLNQEAAARGNNLLAVARRKEH